MYLLRGRYPIIGDTGEGELLLLPEEIAPLDEKNAYDGKVLVISFSIYTSSLEANNCKLPKSTFVFRKDK